MPAKDRLKEFADFLPSLSAESLYPDPSLRWFAHYHPPFTAGDPSLAMLSKSADVSRPGDGAHRPIDIIRVISTTGCTLLPSIAPCTTSVVVSGRAGRMSGGSYSDLSPLLGDMTDPRPIQRPSDNSTGHAPFTMFRRPRL